MKCQACKEQEAEWAWQPFGPGETPNEYSFLGSHARGFPIIKVCDSCKNAFQRGDFPVKFTYKGHSYVGEHHQVREVEANLWLGDTYKPSELNDAPCKVLNRDTPKGIDVAALVYEDNADLIPLFLAAPQLAVACERLDRHIPLIERHLEYAIGLKEDRDEVRLCLGYIHSTIRTLHANQESKGEDHE